MSAADQSDQALPADQVPPADQTPGQKKRNPLITAVLLAVGVIGIVTGFIKMNRGAPEFFGSSVDPQVQTKLEASKQALEAAGKELEAAAAPFQTMRTDFDAKPLDVFRHDQRTGAEAASEHFAKAAEGFRNAAKELEESAAMEMNDTGRSYVTGKAKAFGMQAKVLDQNREIIRLVLDESIVSKEELHPKLAEIAASLNANQKAADEAYAQADAIAKAK